jgi:hypothetical protein
MDNILLYSTQLVVLKKLLKKELLSEKEYEEIKNKFMDKYKINGRFLALRNP